MIHRRATRSIAGLHSRVAIAVSRDAIAERVTRPPRGLGPGSLMCPRDALRFAGNGRRLTVRRLVGLYHQRYGRLRILAEPLVHLQQPAFELAHDPAQEWR